MSSWHAHIFKVIKILDGHLVHQQNKIGKTLKWKSLWKCENLRSRWSHFATELARFTVLKKKGGGGGGREPPSFAWLVFYFIFIFYYAFERMNISKMAQIKWTGKKLLLFYLVLICIYHVLNDCKCEDSNDGAFVVWFCCFLIQKWLLLNVQIGYFSVVTPSLGCLTLKFFDRGSF